MNLESLKKKWHGLPVWAWALLAAVLVFGTYYIIKRRNSSSSNSTPDTSSQAAQDESAVGPPPDYGSGGSGSSPFPSNTGPDNFVGRPVNQDAPLPIQIFLDQPKPDQPAPTPTTPTTTVTPTVVKSSLPSKAVLVPSNATATSLQKTVEKVGPSAVYVPNTKTQAQALNHPAAVKVTANKTGASANKTQGVFSIH